MDSFENIPTVVAVIAAGGSGSRLGVEGGKQLLEIESRPVVSWTIDAIAAADEVSRIVVICDPDRVEEYAAAIFETVTTEKDLELVSGGQSRQESVARGLNYTDDADFILIHDGARPLISPESVSGMIALMLDNDNEYDGVVAGHPSVDTIKIVDEHDIVKATVDRSEYWMVQTPQIFKAAMVRAAYTQAAQESFVGTDDSSLVEHIGGRVRMYETSRNNIKITLADDVTFAQTSLAMMQAKEGKA